MCKQVQDLLSAYIDGEMLADESAMVRAHLDCCESCRLEEAEMRRLKWLLASTPEAQPSPGFEDRLFSAVFDPRVEAKAQRPSAREGLAAFSGVVLMAASLTLLILNFAATNGQPHQRDEALAFEARRDQSTLAGADPFAGSPTIVPTNYAGR